MKCVQFLKKVKVSKRENTNKMKEKRKEEKVYLKKCYLIYQLENDATAFLAAAFPPYAVSIVLFLSINIQKKTGMLSSAWQT